MREGEEQAETQPAAPRPEQLRWCPSPGSRPRFPAPRRPAPTPALEAEGHGAAKAAAAGASGGV